MIAAFLFGLIVGATIGICIASLCVAAGRADERSRELEQRVHEDGRLPDAGR